MKYFQSTLVAIVLCVLASISAVNSQGIQCPPLAEPGNGSIEYTPPDPNPINHDLLTRANYSCNPGFKLDPPDGNILVCVQTDSSNPIGEWSPQPPPTCVPVCNQLTLENGMITYSFEGNDLINPVPLHFHICTIATHVCDEGFTLVGSVERKCEDSLTWSGEPPRCERITQCPPLAEPGNGSIEYTPPDPNPINHDLQTRANYSCNPGFKLDPPDGNILVCVENETDPSNPLGVWSPQPPPTCVPVCNRLTLENGMITYSLIEGNDLINPVPLHFHICTIATHVCDEGFTLVGSIERKCEDSLTWSGEPASCERRNGTTVNDTITGDPLFTVPLYIQDKSALVNANTGLAGREDEIVNLCFEVHGRRDTFINLVSDVCTVINARYALVDPSIPQEVINIIDRIYVRAVDDAGRCRNIEVALNPGGVCTASVDGANIDSMYQNDGITIRRYRNRVRITVPNCNTNGINLVMWVFCLNNTFLSASSTVEQKVTFQAHMLRFVIARGLNLQPTSHGLVGQFWNVPISVESFTGTVRDNIVNTHNYYEVTVRHPDGDTRTFSAWLYRLTWESREEYCLYAGNQQAGPVYEVLSPNDAVIEGTYRQYLVDDPYSSDFTFNEFEESRC